jgi:aromatic-L-amino-acid/L-tryptophan decarboxylase
MGRYPTRHREDNNGIQFNIAAHYQPGITHWQHPKFFSWFPCNSSYPGILGELYSSMFNCAAFNWICSPSVTECISFSKEANPVETVVLDWLAAALGLPDVFLSLGHGGGVIQGSASEAAAVAVVAARDRYLASLEPTVADAIRGKLLVFGSDQTHSCTQKAAMIAGVKFRAIPAKKGSWSLSGHGVRHAIEAAKAEGFAPFFLTATLGTTPTCATDDLEGIAEVGKDYPEIWLHVDAAVSLGIHD